MTFLCGWFLARPMPGVRPGGRPTFWATRKWAKSRPRTARPSLARGVPCGAQNLRPRAKLPSLRFGLTVARSQSLKRACARGLKFLALLGGTQRGSEGTARTSGLMRLALGFRLLAVRLLGVSSSKPPSITGHRGARLGALQALTRDACSSRAKRSEFVAASMTEKHRVPSRLRMGGFAGAVSLLTFLGAQESESPAGANSRHGPRQSTSADAEHNQ